MSHARGLILCRRLSAAVGVVALAALALDAQAPPLPPAGPPPTSDRAAALQVEGEQLARESRTILGELRKLEVERDLQEERARLAGDAVAIATRELNLATERLTAIQAERESQLPDIRARLVEMYKGGRSGNARLLLGATSVRDFARTSRALASMARVTESRLNEHRRLLERARAEQVAMAEALRRLQDERTQVEQGLTAAANAVRARTALLSDIDRRRDLAAQLAGELQVATRRLDEQVSTIAAPPSASLTAPSAVAASPRGPVRGGLEWPLNGRVTGRFGEAATRAAGGVARNGIEIEAPDGASARAVHAGSVVFAGPLPGFGTLVIVDHSSGFHSVYGYLGSTSVARGDAVEVGREVGRVGPVPGGPLALYFEFRVDGRSVDPLQWLRPLLQR